MVSLFCEDGEEGGKRIREREKKVSLVDLHLLLLPFLHQPRQEKGGGGGRGAVGSGGRVSFLSSITPPTRKEGKTLGGRHAQEREKKGRTSPPLAIILGGIIEKKQSEAQGGDRKRGDSSPSNARISHGKN